ncbi:MAG: recombination-associated protein RdgC [Kiritimatiellae bacterium]|nr:recombination-associated protein RdgC [Kiritimatiellia bacterium]
MPLSKASSTFRVFRFDAKLDPDELLEAFARDAIPPLETLNVDPISGWASPRFLVDREINGETCRAGKFVHVFLSKAQRRLPSSLLRTYCRMEEIEFMKANGLKSVNRNQRREIKESLAKRMLPKMPPTLQGIEVAVDTDRNLLYADCSGDKQVDALAVAFAQAARTALVPLDAAGAAQRLFAVAPESLEPASFTPADNGDFVVNDIGLDFFTWLYWRFRTGKNEFRLSKNGPPAKVELDGPISLVLQGEGAFRTSLADGTPLFSAEAKTALLGGKKVSGFKFAMELGEAKYQCSVTAPSFCFRSAKPPATDRNRDENAAFLDHMAGLQDFADAFYGLYGEFLRERSDAGAWTGTVAAIREWMPGMDEKA